jgi:hypothetical protein
VAVQLPVRAHPQTAAGVRAEPVGVARARALRGEGAADVRLQVRLAQPLAGPVGEHRGGVGGQAEQRRDLAGRLVLDGGVPQYGLPALGQRAERPDRQGAFGLVHGADVGAEVGALLGGGRTGRGDREHREVLHELFAAGGVAPTGGDPADRGQQVGAHRGFGAAAAPDGLQRTGEDLTRQVLGGERVAAAGAGVAAHGFRVAAVQLLVGAVPAGSDLIDQLGVGAG